MVELKFGPKTVDLPYTVRIPDVSEALFDELVDEDSRAELIDGVMIVHSPATMEHDDVSGFLRPLMRGFAERRKLGRVYGADSLVRLVSGRKFAPDIYFLERHRVPRKKSKEFRGAPDLAVEVLSPSNRDVDLDDKRPAYRAAKVREIWFVDPAEQQLIVDRRGAKAYTTTRLSSGIFTSEVLAGFWLEVDWLWQEPMPEFLDCLNKILS